MYFIDVDDDCCELPFLKLNYLLRILYASTVFLSVPSISLTIPTSSMPPNYLFHYGLSCTSIIIVLHTNTYTQAHTNPTSIHMYVTHWSQCRSNVSVFLADHLGLDNLTWSLCLEKTDLLLSLACNYLVWDLMKFSLSISACQFMWSLHWSCSDEHIIELRQVHHPCED